MSQEVSHQDSTRSKVGITAHMVASARAAEHNNPNGLFKDPFAELLGCTPEMRKILPVKDSAEEHINFNKDKGARSGIAVRTRKIDDELQRFLLANSVAQVCALGAGLDTRAWRLNYSDQALDTSTIKYFEVDFPEIFDFKLGALATVHAEPLFKYAHVSADLSVPGWIDKLTDAGFDPLLPTFWLLEGFTGYLTETEFHTLFGTLTELSANKSRLVATFLTPETRTTVTLHRFRPEVPVDEVTKHKGWYGVQQDIRVVALSYNRPMEGDQMNGYYFVVADYEKGI